MDPYLTNIDEVDHGTCILSRVAGPYFGTAKDVDIVMVKLANTDSMLRSKILKGLADTANGVQRKKRGGKSNFVVNLSRASMIQDSCKLSNLLLI